MNTKNYFEDLEKQVKGVYAICEEAREKGLDPADKVEIPLAMSMAEKVVGLISTLYPQTDKSGIAERIIELEKKWGTLDPAVCLQIAEEVSKQKFCKFASLLEAIDAGVRIGFAYITLGVVSSPIEGLTEIKIKQTREGKEYLSPYFSGPVRSAGGTGAAFSLVILDHLREIFGYNLYDPSEEEIKRSVTEIHDYHERVTNLQYMPTDDEIIFLASHLPMQVNGEASEKLEVSNYKNLNRIETNFVRGGFCLVIGEGIAQKAAKIKRYVIKLRKKGFKLSAWDFLDDFIELHKKRDMGAIDSSPTYIKDLVAGRPVFGHPSRSGGFRFRYGRGRVNGFSAASIHPATMAITDGFIAIGTQLKIEKPTKGCAITSCDVIDGPIVKLFNGSVRKIKDMDYAKKIYKDVEEIIYLGDILFPFSDLSNRNHDLIKPGYVEEWWRLELREKNPDLEKEIDYYNVSLDKALEISKKYEIPLYPKYIFYWTEISKKQFYGLLDWLKHSKIDTEIFGKPLPSKISGSEILNKTQKVSNKKIILPYIKTEQEKFGLGKRALELLGVEHDVTIENIVLNPENRRALFANLGIDENIFESEEKSIKEAIEESKEKLIKQEESKNVLELVNIISNFEIKDKAGTFIGTRMGRPEKAKVRKLEGSPNVLFPVGSEGGRLRSVQAACGVGSVKSAFPIYYCKECKKDTIYRVCENCKNKSDKMFYCHECKEKSFKSCEEHKKAQSYCTQEVNIKNYFENAIANLGLEKTEIPLLVKGIRGTSSAEHKTENLAKGILRAMFNLQVNKDGTVRFDATELPLVSFKPKEISVSVETLKKLGYDKDIFEKPLVSDEQIIELMPHDIVLPCSSESPDERADDVFIRVANFVDDLLVRFYGLKPFYNIKKREDLIGQLGVCMAPHNCAGVICRFIGFSNTLGLFASPYMHAAIRRDCDGDEMAIMLLGDVLLNFSRKFLPSHRGGTQDAPLVLNAKINAGEVDDQILDFEFVNEYPLELYKLAEQGKHSSEIKINNVREIMKQGKNPFVNFGFTHNTSNFNEGIVCSSYKLLVSMQDKVKHQMEFVEKIRAVDTSDTARLILDRHFIRDMKGNLRKFSMQTFRCVGCNEIVRRPPLAGVCPKCGGKIIFTIHEGGIRKYLEPALELAKKYNLSKYMQQNLELTKRYIDSIFGRELEKQEGLGKWF